MPVEDGQVESRRRRARVLQVAYACSPFKGSEPGVGWNRAVQAARYCDVWVLCEGREFRSHLEQYLSDRAPIEGLRIEYVDRMPWEEKLARFPGLYYPLYTRWHRRALNRARRLHQQHDFDLAHQVNMCGFREPGYLWKLNIPFVWGPIGGTQNHPWRNLDQAGFAGAIQEAGRSILNAAQLRASPRVRRAAGRADVLLAANHTIQRQFHEAVGCRPEVLCEIGASHVEHQGSASARCDSLRILWIGQFRPFKALPMLLRAMRSMVGEVDVELRVVGDGPQHDRWHRIAERLGLERHITWTRWLTHGEALEQYAWADVLAFTSLRDTTGTVVLEALSQGVPVVAPQHQGVGDMVTPESGVLIPLGSTREMIDVYRRTLLKMAADPAWRASLSRGAEQRAADYTWDAQGLRMQSYYRRVLGSRFDWSDRLAPDKGHDTPCVKNDLEVVA